MNSLRLLPFLCIQCFLFLNSASAQNLFRNLNADKPIMVAPYEFPISNPLVATLSVSVVEATETPIYEPLTIDLLPGRSDLNPFPVSPPNILALFKHDNDPTAPLIFLIPGVGGNPLYSTTLFIAEYLYHAGFTVVTLPATMSWQFALGVSSSGYPGYSPRDAEDMYRLMIFLEKKLKTHYQLRPRNYGLMGYSLGGLDSAFVSLIDRRQKHFQFNRILMINPPLQKAKSISALDGLMAYENKKKSWWMIGDLLTEFESYWQNAHFSFKDLLGWKDSTPLNMSDSQMAWLIGASFRRSLHDVLLVTQSIRDLGILPSAFNRWTNGHRDYEAYKYNFHEYLAKVLLVDIDKNQPTNFTVRDLDELIAQTDVRPVLNELTKLGQTWAVYHNTDDFIFHKGDNEAIMATATASRLYPHGGHLGNVWYSQNKKDVIDYFAKMK